MLAYGPVGGTRQHLGLKDRRGDPEIVWPVRLASIALRVLIARPVCSYWLRKVIMGSASVGRVPIKAMRSCDCLGQIRLAPSCVPIRIARDG